MKKLLPVGLLVGLLVLGLAYVLSLTGPNEYAARIAEAQADLETARALRDQAEAISVIGAGLGRVSFVQSLTLFLLVAVVGWLVGWLVYVRLQAPKAGPVRPAQLTALQSPQLEGARDLDPALVNQLIQLEMLRTLRGMSAPQLPTNVYLEETKK